MEKGKIITKVLTDNVGELIKVTWDGERFGLTRTRDGSVTIILSPREMLELINFGSNLGREV